MNYGLEPYIPDLSCQSMLRIFPMAVGEQSGSDINYPLEFCGYFLMINRYNFTPLGLYMLTAFEVDSHRPRHLQKQ